MMANMFRNEEDRLATIGFCLGGMAAGVLIGYPFGGLVFHYFGKQILFETIILAILILLCKAGTARVSASLLNSRLIFI